VGAYAVGVYGEEEVLGRSRENAAKPIRQRKPIQALMPAHPRSQNDLFGSFFIPQVQIIDLEMFILFIVGVHYNEQAANIPYGFFTDLNLAFQREILRYFG
jgi:hypothetical protein